MLEDITTLIARVLAVWTQSSRVAPASKKAIDTFPLTTWNTILCHYINVDFKNIAEQEYPPLPADLESIPWEGSTDFGAYMCHTLNDNGEKFKGSYSGAATGLGQSDLPSGLDGRQKYHNITNIEVFDKNIFHDELIAAKREGRCVIWSQTFSIPPAHVDTMDSNATPVLPKFDDLTAVPSMRMNLVAMRLLCRMAELFFAVHFKAFANEKIGYRLDVQACCPWYDDIDTIGLCSHSSLNEGIGAGDLVAIQRQDEFDEAWKAMCTQDLKAEDPSNMKRKLRQHYMDNDELAAEEAHRQVRITRFNNSVKDGMTGAEKAAHAKRNTEGQAKIKAYLDRLGVSKSTWSMTDLQGKGLWPDWDKVTEEELHDLRKRIVQAEKDAKKADGGTRAELAGKASKMAKKYGAPKATAGQSKLNFIVKK